MIHSFIATLLPGFTLVRNLRSGHVEDMQFLFSDLWLVRSQFKACVQIGTWGG